MIHYLAVDWKPLRCLLECVDPSVAEWLKPLPYDRLPQQMPQLDGAVVFTDLERLSARRRRDAARAWRELRQRTDVHVVNSPTTLGRRALLETLHRRGVNRFAVHRPWRLPPGTRFPVFLRVANEHLGNVSGLLSSRGAVAKELLRYVVRRPRVTRWLPQLLAVEHLDTADEEGVYRKYSCFRVAGRILPRHLFFGSEWMLKLPQLMEPQQLREERAFLEENPHRETLEGIFALAAVDYGRIDYSLVQGELQVWEINTNPMVCRLGNFSGPRAEVLPHFLERFLPLLASLDPRQHPREPAEPGAGDDEKPGL